MKRPMRNNFKALLFGICYGLLCGLPAYADDTEIYLGAGVPTSAASDRNNVLFILDTSGSMGTTVTSTGKSRMANMQEAFTSIMNSTNNINVGLMRFNDPGGPVLYPVTNIDGNITTSTSTTSGSTVTSRVAAGSDDAEQMSSGTVDLTSTTLDMAYGSPAGSSSTLTIKLTSNSDDASETVPGKVVTTTDSTLTMDSARMNGFRFQSVNVPNGATIESATLVFTPTRSDTDTVRFSLVGEAADNSAGFSASSPNRLSDRTTTTATVDWTPGAWSKDNANTDSTTPDLKTIIQEIVNRTGWNANQSLTILQKFVSGSGSNQRRRAYGRDSSSSKAAVLTIKYSTGTAGQETVGLRFTNVGIPKGVNITSATIEFTSTAASSAATNLTVHGEANGDAPTYTTASNSITSRTKTTASASWTPGTWAVDDVVQTPDLKALVKEITDRSDWCGGNAMAFQITGTDIATRIAHSYEGDSTRAPVLRVTYDANSIPASGSCMIQDLIYRVSSSNSDAAQSGTATSPDLTNSTMSLSSTRTNGLRFSGIMVQNSAVILNASLEYTAKKPSSGSNTGAASFTIKGQDSDNAAVFTTAVNDITNRTTTGSVAWSPTDWIENSVYSTPELKDLVQAIVNRAGWAPGNALAFIQTASSGTRYASTFDSNSSTAVLLRLKVKGDGSAITTSKSVRSTLIDLVNDFVPGGYTPIVDTLYEGAQYFRGGPVLYGKNRGAATKYGRVSTPESWTGGTLVRDAACTDANLNATACATENITGSPMYTSPIKSECAGNYIVLLTDGEANHNNSTALVPALTGGTCVTKTTTGETCGIELAEFLHTKDQSTTVAGTNQQYVNTYTISFNNDGGSGAVTFLNDMATAGGGKSYTASTASELTAIFQTIIQNIAAQNSTFIAPTATVNQFNRLTNRNELYFSLFKAGGNPVWAGNLKRYGVNPSTGDVIDFADKLAVDSSTGFFNAGAKSWWLPSSAAADGPNVEQGGAAGVMNVNTRKVYTNTSGTANVSLTATGNEVNEANAGTTLTKTMFGISTWTDADFVKLLKWARGMDVLDGNGNTSTTDSRLEMGDPVHSKPVIINYGGTSTAPVSTAFIGTNQGYLHAFNTTNGSEQFAFVPRELLPNLQIFYENNAGTKHPDGLDGPISYWLDDVNGNNQIETATDHVTLYVGMRRGGRNYYALDVTDVTLPKLKWMVTGGTNTVLGDFTELGETWSIPVHTKVKINGTAKDVLVFAGGYDNSEDTKTVRSADSQGRAIFIVDTADGSLIWSGGPGASGFTKQFTDMNYAIPSDIRVIDINSDGLADQMYVGDMGGQLWRFDIDNTATAASALVYGGVIADLNTSGADGAAGNRRFFYAPDVSLNRATAPSYLAIAIGSGWRAHPLDQVVKDRFYMVRSESVFGPPASYAYTKLTESNLYDATDNLIGVGPDKQAEIDKLNAKEGWYIILPNTGEKVLAESTTINSQVVFTTYQPGSTVVTSSCSASSVGTGRLYIVSVADATPTEDLDNSGDPNNLTTSDRSKTLKFSGIPPALTTMFTEACDANGENCTIQTNALEELEKVDIDFGDINYKTYWQEVR